MRSPTRLVALIAGLAMAAALLPADASAQSRRGGGGGGRAGAGRVAVARPVARPVGHRGGSARVNRPVNGSRGYRGGYYGRGNYGYRGYGYRGYGYRGYYGSYYRSYPYWWGSFGLWPYGYYSPYYWGSYGWGSYGWGYPYGGYWGGYYRGYDASYTQGAARLQVTPRETEVFVDGYYAGEVDDFDGFSQRLRLEPGEHEVTLFLDGHRPFTQKLMFTVGQTFRIKHEMEPVAAGEPAPTRPVPIARPAAPAPARRYGRTPTMRRGSPADRDPDPAAAEPEDDRPLPPPPPREPRDEPRPERGAIEATAGAAGQVSLRVQPEDAEIFVDGEPWTGSSGSRLVVSLAPGVHRLEVRKDGFETYSGLVRVRPGAVTTLNVALTREGTR